MAKSVNITANDDGTFTVEVEAEQSPAYETPEGPENGPADMAEDQAEGEPSQTVQSVDEAMQIAAQMLGGEAQAPMMPGEDEFTKGFKNIRGTPEQQQHGVR